MVDITIVSGSYNVYKPTYIWGGSSCRFLLIPVRGPLRCHGKSPKWRLKNGKSDRNMRDFQLHLVTKEKDRRFPLQAILGVSSGVLGGGGKNHKKAIATRNNLVLRVQFMECTHLHLWHELQPLTLLA